MVAAWRWFRNAISSRSNVRETSALTSAGRDKPERARSGAGDLAAQRPQRRHQGSERQLAADPDGGGEHVQEEPGDVEGVLHRPILA